MKNFKNSKIWIFKIILYMLLFIFFAFPGSKQYYLYAKDNHLIAWWNFNQANNKEAKDIIGNIEDPIEGNFKYTTGVKGLALKFDGFTTRITRKAKDMPKLGDEFSIEAWIALAAYPWNWCPILSQKEDETSGYYFAIGPQGQLGLQAAINGQWQKCISKNFAIPLRKWTHVLGIYSQSKGLAIYVNSQLAGELRIKGKINYASEGELRIGMNRKKVKPSNIHRQFGTLPWWFSLDGLIDEIKIYNHALNKDEVEKAFSQYKPSTSPDLPPRVMPSGFPGPGRFGAYYCKLKYYDEWDALWPVGPYADIVVEFDKSPVRVVFWRGTRYSPAWVTENGLWMADQSVEAWNNKEGCFEHMQDRHCRYSHVRIIENTDARIVIHWRYAPVSSHNHLWKEDEKTGWSCWVDEYYYFYPDQTGIRKVTWRRGSLGKVRQFQESIPLCHPGQLQGDVINTDYVTVANMKGDTQVFSYVKNPLKKRKVIENPTIQMHNLKSKFKPFIIFQPGSKMGYLKDLNIEALSQPGSCNHWPVGQMLCDGRTSQAPDRASSFLGFPITDPLIHEGSEQMNWVCSLYGMTKKPVKELVVLAKSWAHAPKLKISSNAYENEGYDISQRAYLINSKKPDNPSILKFDIMANEKFPLNNACFVIKGWGYREAMVKIDGNIAQKDKAFRVGHVPTLKGGNLIIWIAKKLKRHIEISIIPIENNK